MRCKSCLQTFSQPSKVTKDTQTCAICRGTKTCLKSRDLCERSPQFIINMGIKLTKKYSFENHDPCFIEHSSPKKIGKGVVV